MDKMEALIQFVRKHTTRGACKCGLCVASDGTTEKPTGHTVNLTFFEVGMFGNPDAVMFQSLAQDAGIMPPAGKEVSYIQLGGDIGDQGTALLTMGLGHLLGAWKVLSPDIVMPSLPANAKKLMAAQGMVKILREKVKMPVPPSAPPAVIAPPPAPLTEAEKDFDDAEKALANPVRIPADELTLRPKSEGRRRGKKES